jgi:hypothetical protein
MELVLFTDADLSTPIHEVEKLVAAIAEGNDVAIASRFCDEAQDVDRSLLRTLQGRAFSYLVRATTVRGFHDTQCGFKLFRRDAARELFGAQRIDRWGFDVEILFLAQKWNLRVKEVAVSWHRSNESKLSLSTPATMVRDLLQVHWYEARGGYPRPIQEQATQDQHEAHRF